MLRAFEERRLSGFGSFISEDKLRTMDNRRLSDVIDGFAPGVRLMRTGLGSFAMSMPSSREGLMVPPPGSKRLPRQGNAPQGCYATVYLDGTLLFDLKTTGTDSTVTPPDLSAINIDQLGGVEYYSGNSAPPSFRQSGCGLLRLWTRER
jgi:hypothetical protein